MTIAAFLSEWETVALLSLGGATIALASVMLSVSMLVRSVMRAGGL